jgi:serine/threonine protein kinase
LRAKSQCIGVLIGFSGQSLVPDHECVSHLAYPIQTIQLAVVSIYTVGFATLYSNSSRLTGGYLLGQSDFAEVYLGQHMRLNAQVAMKMWRTHLKGEDWGALRRDAQMIAELDHPNIVPIRDFEVLGDVPLFVMDYIPDGTLRKRHPHSTCVPLSDVASMVTQIANTLQYVHEHGCMHLDIKPENLLVGPRNRILLSDFAMMTLTRGMQTAISAGTAPYMAPEQISGRPLPASDQYALGIVVYEWLCGARPFEGAYAEVFAGHLMTPPPSLRAKVPALSAEVEQVVMTALAKDPRKRFDSIKAFAAALSQASNIKSAPSVLVETKGAGLVARWPLHCFCEPGWPTVYLATCHRSHIITFLSPFFRPHHRSLVA